MRSSLLAWVEWKEILESQEALALGGQNKGGNCRLRWRETQAQITLKITLIRRKVAFLNMVGGGASLRIQKCCPLSKSMNSQSLLDCATKLILGVAQEPARSKHPSRPLHTPTPTDTKDHGADNGKKAGSVLVVISTRWWAPGNADRNLDGFPSWSAQVSHCSWRQWVCVGGKSHC